MTEPMENDKSFSYLLDRYFDDQASSEEMFELIGMIKSGKYDEALKEKIDQYLLRDSGERDIAPWESEQILQSILQQSVEQKAEAKEITLRPWRWRWVAAAAVLVIAATVVWVTSNVDFVTDNQKLVLLPTEPAIYTGKQFIVLPDSSTVLLNEDSRLTVAGGYGGSKREITLKGEAYFDVRHDPVHPFEVITGDITTKVLGTAFNVKAYSGQSEIKVTVTRGKVQVGDAKKVFGTILPEQQLTVNAISHEFVQDDVSTTKEVEWVKKTLILRDVNMGTAAALIEARYNVKIVFANNDIKNCPIEAEFIQDETLEQVLQVISTVVKFKYTIESDGNVKLEGKGCK